MLFNSSEFLFIFLPVTLVLFYISVRFKAAGYAKAVLLLASYAFYAYWDYRYLLLLLVSIFFNFYFGKLVSKSRSIWVLSIGVGLNLLLLGYYKYADFFITNINTTFGSELPMLQIVLPLAISFFTFTQIAFLVDCYRQLTKEYNLFNYMLFVVVFPHLIAGPIVHHKALIPQFEEPETYTVQYKNIALGLALLVMGLFKKVVIADHVAGWVSYGFDQATTLTVFQAWEAALAYTFQLYFDFSAYSEMAIGLGWLFNFQLPINFLSPYKANSIIDFWKRWHVTLSTFLRDYLYIAALGGNRKGKFRRYLNLFITMVLGGFWHGAGWTFVIWGTLHGVYLVINHAFRSVVEFLGGTRNPISIWLSRDENAKQLTILRQLGRPAALVIARVLTFICVIIGWVFFRAHTFQDAFKVLGSMFGMNGVELGMIPSPDKVIVLLGLLAFCHFAPDAMDLMKRFQPNWKWAFVLSLLLIASLINLNKISEFLYFQF